MVATRVFWFFVTMQGVRAGSGGRGGGGSGARCGDGFGAQCHAHEDETSVLQVRAAARPAQTSSGGPSFYETPLNLEGGSLLSVNVYSDAFNTQDQRLTLQLDTGSAGMSVPAQCVQDNVKVIQKGIFDQWNNKCDFVSSKIWVMDFDQQPLAVEDFRFFRCNRTQSVLCDGSLMGRNSGIVGGMPGYMGTRKDGLTLASALAKEFGANYGHGVKAWRTGSDVEWSGSELSASLLIGDPYDNMVWRDDVGSWPGPLNNSWRGALTPGLSVTLHNSDGSEFARHEGPAFIDTGAPELQFVDADLFNDQSRSVKCPFPSWAVQKTNRHCVWDATAKFTFEGSDGTQLEWSVDLPDPAQSKERFSTAIVCLDRTSPTGCSWTPNNDPSVYHPGNGIFFGVQMVYWDAAKERVGIAPL